MNGMSRVVWAAWLGWAGASWAAEGIRLAGDPADAVTVMDNGQYVVITMDATGARQGPTKGGSAGLRLDIDAAAPGSAVLALLAELRKASDHPNLYVRVADPPAQEPPPEIAILGVRAEDPPPGAPLLAYDAAGGWTVNRWVTDREGAQKEVRRRLSSTISSSSALLWARP